MNSNCLHAPFTIVNKQGMKATEVAKVDVRQLDLQTNWIQASQRLNKNVTLTCKFIESKENGKLMGTIQKFENYPKLFIFDMKNDNIPQVANKKENTAKSLSETFSGRFGEFILDDNIFGKLRWMNF